VAKTLLKTTTITINGVDLSDHARAIRVATSRPEVDVTAFGATYQEFLPGIGTAEVEVEFFQDFAAGEVDATLFPLSQSDTPFTIIVKPTNGAISATNPAFTMDVVLLDYSPLDGSVGEASTTSVTFRNATQAGLVRDTTP
jgi:hypothetical protein